MEVPSAKRGGLVERGRMRWCNRENLEDWFERARWGIIEVGMAWY